MTPEEYTEHCVKEAKELVNRLKALAAMMRSRGDESRAMDIEEAVTYIETAVDDA